MAYTSSDEDGLPDLMTEEGKLEMLTTLTELDQNICDDDIYDENQFGELETDKYDQLMNPNMPEYDAIAIATVEAALATKAGQDGLTASELSKAISDLSETWFDLPKMASLLLPFDERASDNPESLLHHDMLRNIVECVDGNRYRLKRNHNNKAIMSMMECSDMAEQLNEMRNIAKSSKKKDHREDSDWLEKDKYNVENFSSHEKSFGSVQRDDGPLQKASTSGFESTSESSFQTVSKLASSGSYESTKDHAGRYNEKNSTNKPKRHAPETVEAKKQPKMVSTIVRKGLFSDEESENSLELNDGDISDHEDLADIQKEKHRPSRDETSPIRRAVSRAHSPPPIISSTPKELMARKLDHVPGKLHPKDKHVKDIADELARETKQQNDLKREKIRQEQHETERRLEQLKINQEQGQKQNDGFNLSRWNPQSGTSAFNKFHNKGFGNDRPFGQRERNKGFGNSPSPKGFDQRAPPRKNRFNNKSPSFDKSSHAAQMKAKNEWFNKAAPQPQPHRQITPTINRPVTSYASPVESNRMPQSSSAYGFGERDYGRADQPREVETYSRQSGTFSQGYQVAEKNTRNEPGDNRYPNTCTQDTRYPETGFGGYNQRQDMHGNRSNQLHKEQQSPPREASFGNQYRDEFSGQRLPEPMSMYRESTRGNESRMSSYGRNEDQYRRSAAQESYSQAPSTYGNQSRELLYDERYSEPDRQSSHGPESNFGGYRRDEGTFRNQSSMSRSLYEQSGAPSSFYGSQNRDMHHEPHRYTNPAPVRHDQVPHRVAQTPQLQPPKNAMIDFIKAYMILFAKQDSEIQIIFALNDDYYKGWETLSSNLQDLFVTVVYDLVQGFEAKTAIKWSLLNNELQLPAPETIFGPNWAVDFTRIANELQMPIKAVKFIQETWITLL